MNSHHDRSGETIANFRLINQIGAGNVGIVYNALQLSMNRKVALKILQPELAENPDFVEKFLREARLAARLDHPNIIQAIDAGRSSSG